VRAATECREWIKALFRAVDRVGVEVFSEVIRRGDACDAMGLVRRAMIG